MTRECVVKDCTNRTNQGGFVGEICTPCYEFITVGTGKFSQAYRNVQKQWQGLSDDEIEELFPDESKLFSLEDFARAIEAKLKEKNS